MAVKDSQPGWSTREDIPTEQACTQSVEDHAQHISSFRPFNDYTCHTMALEHGRHMLKMSKHTSRIRM